MSAPRAIRPRHDFTEIDRVLAAIHGSDDDEDEDEDGPPIRAATRSELPGHILRPGRTGPMGPVRDRPGRKG
jgi:hypothetical protein